jgi:P450-derived glycosyltransferase activator
MSDLGQAIRFASRLYRERAGTFYRGYVRRRPMALLDLRAGRDDPYAIYERMRVSGPLARNGPNSWFSTSHRVCDAVLRDRRFGVRPLNPDGTEAELEMDLSFLTMDPPDHTLLRRLVQPAFSPKLVSGYRERIETTVGGLLDRAAADGEFDLVSALAAPLPIGVITALLGIPDADAERFARFGTVVGSALDGIRSLRHAAQIQATSAEMIRLFEDLVALRRREPQDDIVSRLIEAEGGAVRPDEILPVCVLLLIAGFETTVNLIGNSVLALLDHPDQWEALCADPERMAPAAVQEVLRFDPPVQVTSRFVREPLELEGQALGRGQFVVTLIGAANRDPEVHDRPAVFDIAREGAPDNLAFSSGIHYCVGQPLARLEAETALRMLAERMPGLSRGGPVKRRAGVTIRGPIRLPVRAGTHRVTSRPAPARP